MTTLKKKLSLKRKTQSIKRSPKKSPKRLSSKKYIVIRDGLFPIMNPRLNIIKIIENMILLVDHLVEPTLRCKDCIQKHFASLSAYSSELLTLCKTPKDKKEFAFAQALPVYFRVLYELWKYKKLSNEDTACKLRQLRKRLMYKYWTMPKRSEWSGVHKWVTPKSLPKIEV